MAGRPKSSTANTNKQKSTTSSKPIKKVARVEPVVEEKMTQIDKANTEEVVEKNVRSTTKKQYHIKQELDPRSIVTVRNGFHGKLVYRSSRTGERFEWDAFGDEQDMELQELRNARNSTKAFFVNNWFLIDDPGIIDYLGVQKWYARALNFNSFDNVFTKTPEEIESVISSLSAGQRQTVTYRARTLIEDGAIDSIKVINALEKSLSVELIER